MRQLLPNETPNLDTVRYLQVLKRRKRRCVNNGALKRTSLIARTWQTRAQLDVHEQWCGVS